jgi:hypothetical protein
LKHAEKGTVWTPRTRPWIKSGKGAGDAIASSRENASRAASNFGGNSNGGDADMGNTSGGTPRGSPTCRRVPPPVHSNVTTLSKQPPRHVPWKEPINENVDPPAEFEDEDELGWHWC